ncbi:MAG: hypothetical protein M0Z98_09825 [Actinomycetales bacterium]|nr:hypothetical protein [Actinomycetales bacterium]
MGCHRCRRRQVDPESGPSTWRRAVVGGDQVLICPDCQVEGWTDGLDRCRTCGSTVLVKQLGEVVCRACGATDATAGGTRDPGSTGPTSSDAARDALADDVAAALDRVLRGDADAG